jgi:hypothetical protein
VVVLVLLVGICWGLSKLTDRGRIQTLRQVGEVTAVADGPDPGTTVIEVQRYETTWWSIGDSGQSPRSADRPAPASPRTEACLEAVCYRVPGDALRVDVSTDRGRTYTIAWELSGAPYAMLASTYPDLGDPAEHLSSRSIVVHAVDGGHVVFVANGRDGLLYRDVHGEWVRQGAPASGEGCCYWEPPLRLAANPFDLTPYAVVVVALAVLVAGTVPAVRRRSWSGLLAVIALAALAGYGTDLGGHVPGGGMMPGYLLGVPMIVIILVAGITLAERFGRGPTAVANMDSWRSRGQGGRSRRQAVLDGGDQLPADCAVNSRPPGPAERDQ